MQDLSLGENQKMTKWIVHKMTKWIVNDQMNSDFYLLCHLEI